MRFDHPQGLVDAARDFSKQIRSIRVVQGCCVIDDFACAPSERRQRILHRPHMSAPVNDLEGVFAELRLP